MHCRLCNIIMLYTSVQLSVISIVNFMDVGCRWYERHSRSTREYWSARSQGTGWRSWIIWTSRKPWIRRNSRLVILFHSIRYLLLIYPMLIYILVFYVSCALLPLHSWWLIWEIITGIEYLLQTFLSGYRTPKSHDSKEMWLHLSRLVQNQTTWLNFTVMWLTDLHDVLPVNVPCFDSRYSLSCSFITIVLHV